MLLQVIITIFTLNLPIHSVLTTSDYYPNCIKQLDSLTSVTTNFNKNFIDLSSFLFSYRDQEFSSLALKSLKTGDRSVLQARVLQIRNNYIILFAMVSFLSFGMVAIRSKLSYSPALKSFMSKSMGNVLNPCIMITGIISILFVTLFAILVSRLPEHISQANCAQQYLQELIKNGNHGLNWSGINGYIAKTNYQLQSLEFIKQMPASFDFNTQIIQSRIDEHSRYISQFQAAYEGGTISTNESSVTIPQILPQYFANGSSLTQLNTSITNLLILAEAAVKLELSLVDTKSNAEYSYNSLYTKLKHMEVSRDQLNSAQVFQPFNYNKEQLLVLLSRIFIVITSQSIFFYLILIKMLMKVKEPMFQKFVNFLWVILILEVLLVIVLLYIFFEMAMLNEGICIAAEKVLGSQQLYINLTDSHGNVYEMFRPCLYESSSFNDLSMFEMDTASLTAALVNFTNYHKFVNPYDRDFVDGYFYEDAFSKGIQSVKRKQFGIDCNWQYLKDLIGEMDKWTLENENEAGEGCYRHHWVLDIKDCRQGQNVLMLGMSVNKNVTSCLVMHNWTVTGDLDHLATYADLMAYYVPDRPICPITFSKIQTIALKLTNALSQIQSTLEPIKQNLISQQSSLKQFLQILRKNYLLKNQQFQLLNTSISSSNPHTNPISTMIQDLSNCSCIKDESEILYDSYCVNLRADILKVYLTLLGCVVILSVFTGLGMLYGFVEEIEEEDETSVMKLKGLKAKGRDSVFFKEFFKKK